MATLMSAKIAPIIELAISEHGSKGKQKIALTSTKTNGMLKDKQSRRK